MSTFDTFNEGLTAQTKKELSNKHMHIASSPDSEERYELSGEDRAVRNLYAEVLSSAIRDLKRGSDLDAVRAKFKKAKARRAALSAAINNRLWVLAWLKNEFKSDVSFEDCCEVLGLNKIHILRSLIIQGLIPNELIKGVAKELPDTTPLLMVA